MASSRSFRAKLNQESGEMSKGAFKPVEDDSDDDITSQTVSVPVTPSNLGGQLEVASTFEGQFMGQATSPLNHAINCDSPVSANFGSPSVGRPLSQKHSSSKGKVQIVETLEVAGCEYSDFDNNELERSMS